MDRETNHQLPLFDPKTRGTAIFIHPEFVRTVPEKLLMSSSMSTLAACIDALFSSKSEPLSDALLIHALRLLYGALSKPEELESVEKRCDIMLATMLVGMGSDFTGFGISVSVGHAISAMYPLNAGLLNGVTIPYTVEFNQKAEEGMSKLAIGMNIDPEAADRNEQVLAKVNSMLNALPIPHSFSEMGMPEGKFDEIAALAMDDWYLHFNPMPVDAEKLAALIGKAY